MNTVIIDTDNGKVVSVHAGPLAVHQNNIDLMGENIIGIEWPDQNVANKKGDLIDGQWQLIDDMEKIIESARKRKILDIKKQKESILSQGMPVTGEIYNGTEWIQSQVVVNFTGDDCREIDKAIRKFSVIGQSPSETRSERLLKGRSFYPIIFGKNKRLSFVDYTELQAFIDEYQDYQDLADLIELDKKQAVIEAQSIEDIEAIDETSGWEELNV